MHNYYNQITFSTKETVIMLRICMIFHWIECIHIVHVHSRSLMIHWWMMVVKDSIMEEEGTCISYKYRINEVN